jgi:hypothetical protein
LLSLAVVSALKVASIMIKELPTIRIFLFPEIYLLRKIACNRL